MTDLHEVLFQWPHTEPNTVIVTGTFDQWSSSMQLTKGPTGFKGSAKIPRDEKIVYKFIVDEQWMVAEHEPTELDQDGNLNNVYIVPPKPLSSALEADSVVLVSSADHPTGSHNATGEPEDASGPLSQIVADLADTVGFDPINSEQIALPSPNPDPLSVAQVPSPAEPSFAPDVLVTIVPVNVSENNTTVADSVLHAPHEVFSSTASTISTDRSPGLATEEPSTHIIVSTQSAAAGLVPNKPQVVTTLPAPASNSEPFAEVAASHEVSGSEAPVITAEAPQPEISTIVAVNGTSTPKLESASPIMAVENAAVPGTVIDEQIPASSPVDVKEENVKPVAVQGNGTQPAREPQTNGHGPATAVAENNLQTPTSPTTPSKKPVQPFPASSPSNSPTKSTASKVAADSRKKKVSLFGKVKHLFSHDKEKEKEMK